MIFHVFVLSLYAESGIPVLPDRTDSILLSILLKLNAENPFFFFLKMLNLCYSMFTPPGAGISSGHTG